VSEDVIDPDNIPPNVMAELAKEHDTPTEVDLHEDRTKEFKGPNFSRMRTDWDGPNGEAVRKLISIADGVIHKEFADAFTIMNDLYAVVRIGLVDNDGEVLTDQWGYNVWKQSPYGGPDEDWSLLTKRDRETFLLKITTGLLAWDQKAQNAWGEAMFAKLAYEEEFAAGYLAAINRRAENDRVQSGRAAAAQDRHLGVFKTLLSRKAEAVVRSMSLLCQRLKDTGEL
jgi:hypothetical protein